MKKIFSYFLILFSLSFCQSIETVDNIVFDYNQFPKLTFMSNDIEINNEYKIKLEEPFVENMLIISPSKRIEEWAKNNIKGFGVQQQLIITINHASISETTISPEEKIAGIIKKPKEIKFNLFFNVTFNIYDDYESLLAFTEVEINRSVTSKTLISLNEKEQILEDLVYKSLEDFANKSEEMAKEYLSEYIL